MVPPPWYVLAWPFSSPIESLKLSMKMLLSEPPYPAVLCEKVFRPKIVFSKCCFLKRLTLLCSARKFFGWKLFFKMCASEAPYPAVLCKKVFRPKIVFSKCVHLKRLTLLCCARKFFWTWNKRNTFAGLRVHFFCKLKPLHEVFRFLFFWNFGTSFLRCFDRKLRGARWMQSVGSNWALQLFNHTTFCFRLRSFPAECRMLRFSSRCSWSYIWCWLLQLLQSCHNRCSYDRSKNVGENKQDF